MVSSSQNQHHPSLVDRSVWLNWPLLFAFLLAGCTTMETLDPKTPEGAFKIASNLEEDERFEEAIGKFNEVKNRYPYSKLAVEAELRAADVQFKREAYVDAQYAYQTFKELHPRHPKVAYVTHQLAMSYFKQLPSTIDRDLAVADKAILHFDEVLASYPDSEFVKPSAEKKREALKMLADKELYIAAFYVREKQWLSALGRFEGVLKTYQKLDDVVPIALLGAAKAAAALDEAEKADRLIKVLKSRYPNSREADRAEAEMREVKKKKTDLE